MFWHKKENIKKKKNIKKLIVNVKKCLTNLIALSIYNIYPYNLCILWLFNYNNMCCFNIMVTQKTFSASKKANNENLYRRKI